jgi:hypothetical protein
MSTAAILRTCSLFYFVLIVVDWLRSHVFKRFLLELLPLLGMLILAGAIATATNGYLSFGPGTSPGMVVAVMFGAILLGVAARYVFYVDRQFSWLDFAKPLCISPILLLPLMGSIQGMAEFQPMQVISFAMLAFQNGFFWQVVLERAQPKS